MKPKNMKCPVCGKDLLIRSWGRKRDIMSDVFGNPYPLEAFNEFEAECSCGFRCSYRGTQDIWQPCKYKKQTLSTCPHCGKKLNSYKICGFCETTFIEELKSYHYKSKDDE